MTNVLSPFKLSPERIAELREAGATVSVRMEDTGLPEPQYGETQIGTLTDEEAALFLAWFDAQNKLEDLQRNITGDILTRAGEKIKTSDRKKSLHEQFTEDSFKDYATEEEEKEYCRLDMMTTAFRSNLFFTIAERLNAHEFVLGVRSKNRIIKSVKRFEQGGK